MGRLRVFLGFLTFLLLSATCRLLAFDDWLPITAEDQKVTSESEKGADAVILYREETADDNTRHRYTYERIKVLTERGKKYANVEIPFDAGLLGISELRARTVGPDGVVTPFTGKPFNTTIIKAHGVKYQAKTFSLPNVQVGSIIEWKYTTYWDYFLFAPRWLVQEDLSQKHAKFTFIPFSRDSIGVYVTNSRGEIKDRVHYTMIGLPESAAIKTAANGRMELELKDIPAFQHEEFSPPDAVLKMRVNFYYGDTTTSKPQEFWKNEGKYWTRAVDEFIGNPDALAATLNTIVTPSDSPEQKLRKIYRYVQQIKNLTYEQREDTQEGILKPDTLEEILRRNTKEKRTAETVLQRHEGRRDEITRSFIALARAAGIQAYAMRVADRDEIFFQPDVPNPLQLTSEIAIAMVDGKEAYLDPGTPFCPYGLLRWQHNSTDGLRQTPGGGTQIAKTPAANYRDAVSKRVGRFAVAEDGSIHGQIGMGWAGIEALDHRLSGFRTDEAGRKKELEDELRAMLPNGAVVQLLQATGWDDPEAQLSATFKVDVASFASATGKRLLLPAYLFQAARVQPFTDAERKHPVYFNYPYYSIDDVQITFPSQFKVENLPPTQPLRTSFSFYKVQRSATGNRISMNRDFAIAGIAFMQQDYPELKKFFQGVSSGDSESVVLTNAQ